MDLTSAFNCLVLYVCRKGNWPLVNAWCAFAVEEMFMLPPESCVETLSLCGGIWGWGVRRWQGDERGVFSGFVPLGKRTGNLPCTFCHGRQQ